MTVSEMEEVLKNLNLRLTNVEQILPTLATKEDLKPLRRRKTCTPCERNERPVLRGQTACVSTFRLFEQMQERLEIIAAHLVDISQRLPPRA